MLPRVICRPNPNYQAPLSDRSTPKADLNSGACSMNFLLPFHCCKFVAMLVQSAALPPYRTRRGRVEMEQEKAERLRQYRWEGTSFRPAITSCSVIFNKTGERQRFALGIPNLVAGAGGLPNFFPVAKSLLAHNEQLGARNDQSAHSCLPWNPANRGHKPGTGTLCRPSG